MFLKSTIANIRYIKWLDLYKEEKPFQITFDSPVIAPGQKLDNLEFEEHQKIVHNIRDSLESFSLDGNGFQICRHTSQMDPDLFSDPDIVESIYLPEMEALIRSQDKTISRVLIFDWRLRSSETTTQSGKERFNLYDKTAWMRPARSMHVDHSETSSIDLVHSLSPGDADKLLRGRVRIITAWRPIVDAVRDWPLAVCDSSTVEPGDLLESEAINCKFTTGVLYLLNKSRHKVYYLHAQEPDEVLLIKGFESSQDVIAKNCPHGAFRHCDYMPDMPHRRSVEVRALVFS